jgi:hypothetical protein
MPDLANSRTVQAGVRGWLLFLCLMLVAVGPAISVGLMTNEYITFSKYISLSGSSRVAILISLAITTSSVAFGIYAGLRLWTIKPKAVNVAKKALLFGLAADIITTAIGVAVAPMPGTVFLNQTLIHAVPSLLFFAACFAYLNRSVRVSATYFAHGPDDLASA